MQKQRHYNDDNINEAVKELQAYRTLKTQIAELKQKREEYRERYTALQAIDYSSIRVMGGQRKDQMVETAIAWADLDLLVKRKEVECERMLWEITEKLDRLPINEHKVLELYYIKGFNIAKIGGIMCYSTRQVLRHKMDGLQEYQKMSLNVTYDVL